ncbi:MAG: VapC toxin family PIN domain ribonuclease [Novosphingobium sp.]|nr:VapC toxin family PIN domain ribonuclease [Novosphingobium sp.]MBX9643934.1 type II toxin-antitoxin system VapC family toxin [Novosphingobium sp.]
MIAVDSSALLAILLGEPERDQLQAVLDESAETVISAGTLIEARMVARGRAGNAMVELLDGLIANTDIVIEPVTERQAALAHSAFVKYGKGNGHPAQLNFGDLFAYALAKAHGIPLLFKGQDFVATDIVPAVPGSKR